jgi:hypothetical protein
MIGFFKSLKNNLRRFFHEETIVEYVYGAADGLQLGDVFAWI